VIEEIKTLFRTLLSISVYAILPLWNSGSYRGLYEKSIRDKRLLYNLLERVEESLLRQNIPAVGWGVGHDRMS